MKISVKKTESEFKTPLLLKLRSSDLLILSTEINTNLFSGVVIIGDDVTNHKLGEYRTDWVLLAFKPFDGEITLSNN